ncbi:hypothetical protein K431DRAFT_304331 [Polychaeton citri CBS 116435]|uniref:Myb-like domain-containing protein n=1 Tax=Polychaeton citri CBS 116435 TaxID=1314669 RepID=A0A9P4Q8W6_9PEZI|nr:hypothetical protein K431DRAFT_304331 [Polychaeton citri CBS 116435]
MSTRRGRYIFEVSPKCEQSSLSPTRQGEALAEIPPSEQRVGEQESLFVSENEDVSRDEDVVDEQSSTVDDAAAAYEEDIYTRAAQPPTYSQRTSQPSPSSTYVRAQVAAGQPAKSCGKFRETGGWIKRKRVESARPHMKWTPSNDRKLLLFGLGREIYPSQYSTIASAFPEKPTVKAVAERLVKLRKEQKSQLNKYGLTEPEADIYDEQGNPVDFEPEQQIQKRPRKVLEQDDDDDDDVVEIEDPRVRPLPPPGSPSDDNRKERKAKRPRVTATVPWVPDLAPDEMPSRRIPLALEQRAAAMARDIDNARETVVAGPTTERRRPVSERPRPGQVEMERPDRFSLRNIPGGYQTFESRRASVSTSASTSRPAQSPVRPSPSQVISWGESRTRSSPHEGSTLSRRGVTGGPSMRHTHIVCGSSRGRFGSRGNDGPLGPRGGSSGSQA